VFLSTYRQETKGSACTTVKCRELRLLLGTRAMDRCQSVPADLLTLTHDAGMGLSGARQPVEG
jgi:hypothetical protein